MGDPLVNAFASRVDCSAGVQMRAHRIDLDGILGNESLIPADDRELARASAFRFERDRSRYLAARRALRCLLTDYLSVDPQAISIGVGPNGKPLLEGLEGACEFNLSHSNGVALIAMHRGPPIGVDIETMSRATIDDGLARQCLSPAEYGQWCGLTDVKSLEGFYSAWTRKEAVLKALGIGLSVEPSSVNVGLEALPATVNVHGTAVDVWSLSTGSVGERAAIACLSSGTPASFDERPQAVPHTREFGLARPPE